MPEETDWSRPKGLPIVITHSPTLSAEESPTSIGVTCVPFSSAWMTARSLELSAPTTVAA